MAFVVSIKFSHFDWPLAYTELFYHVLIKWAHWESSAEHACQKMLNNAFKKDWLY